MPKISLWKPVQDLNYKYIDRVVKENIEMGATGVYVHKYLGPEVGSGDDNKSNVEDGAPTNELTIGDVLFLENRDRKYAPDIIELRGSYQPSDTDFDLTQFGIFLSDDTIFMTFHMNDHVERLGRKLMAGDVLELPHLREFYPLDENKQAVNRFYVVEDASNSSQGYGPTWWGHLWRVRAKMMPAAPEFQDILDKASQGEVWPESGGPVDNPDDCCADTLEKSLSNDDKLQDITDQLIEEAAKDVPYDPLWYDAAHLYVRIDPVTQIPDLIWFKTGDGLPPNGLPLYGSGDAFPENVPVGQYFLRTDFNVPVLFQKQTSCKWVRIEVDQRKLPWTATNKLHDTFIDNTNITKNDDGSTMPEKQALSKVVRPKVTGTVTIPFDYDGDGDAAVPPANVPPIAAITSNFTTGIAPLLVTFGGHTSNDTDGNIVSYLWDFGDATSGSGSAVTHTFATPGTYVVMLTVTDDQGATSSATTQIVVVANQAPIAVIGTSVSSGVEPLTVVFSGNGSFDPDGTVVSYQWDFDDATTGTGSTVSHTYAVAGTYNVTLTVTDNLGATGATTTPIVVTPNQPPTAVISVSTLPTAYPLNVTFDGSGSSDSDGTIVSYQWDFGDAGTGTGAVVQHEYTSPGTYTVTLTVTDNSGNIDVDTTNITITTSIFSPEFGPEFE